MTTPEAQRERQKKMIRLSEITLLMLVVVIFAQWQINVHLGDQADDSHTAQLQACQIGNKKLRKVINQRIVRPIREVLSANGDIREANLFRTVPYAICNNLYPEEGKPHPPYYRHAPLPPLLKPKAETQAPASSSPLSTVPSSPDKGGGAANPGSGEVGGGAVGPPAPPLEEVPPPQQTSPLLCDLTTQLGIPICIGL